MAWYSFATYTMPWLYPYAGPASTPWFTPFTVSSGPPVAYTIFGQTGGATFNSDTEPLTLGMQFSLSRSGKLTGIWWYSPASAVILPSACAIYQVSGASQVPGTLNSSPTWSGAAASGWVKCSYSGPTLSPSVNYIVVVYFTGGFLYYSATGHYWDTGAGSGGLSSGPITAPNNAGSANGQDCFNAAAGIAFPGTTFNATNYWVDVEITA